jgi:type II secretory pathway pseudopilin PulG
MSTPEREQRLSGAAFTLLELLVAVGVLAVMMVFLFNLVAQTLQAWEGGAKRVEAAQAARLGLDAMARELQFAIGGQASVPVYTNPSQLVTNSVPFFASNNSTATRGLPAAFTPVPDSAQIFAVGPLASESNSLGEIGFMAVYVTGVSASQPGFHNLQGYRYYLLRHAVNQASGDFFFRGAVTTNWMTQTADSGGIQSDLRTSLIPNCYQLVLSYFTTNSSGQLISTNAWTNPVRLPSGIMVTAKVMDSKTAARLQSMRTNVIAAADLASNSTTPVGRVLREGTVEVKRFVPLVNSRP